MSASNYFAKIIEGAGLLPPVQEYKFHPIRKWRFDLAWPDLMLALEIEGGIWQTTKTGRSRGHANPKQFIQDIHKYNEATLLGWRLLRVTPEMISGGYALELVERAIEGFK